MTKKESLQKAKIPKLMFYACLTGMVLTVCAMLCTAMLMENGVVGAGEYGIYAKLSLVLGAVGATAYICLRTNHDRLVLSLVSNLASLVFLLCFSMLCGAGECDYIDILLEAAAVVLASVLVCAVASKSTKVRKKKIRK